MGVSVNLSILKHVIDTLLQVYNHLNHEVMINPIIEVWPTQPTTHPILRNMEASASFLPSFLTLKYASGSSMALCSILEHHLRNAPALLPSPQPRVIAQRVWKLHNLLPEWNHAWNRQYTTFMLP